MNVLIMINFLQNKLNMKKLKITIAGEVKTFDLPENGKYKVEIVDKYMPKIGDCVRVECRNPNKTSFYWFKVKEFTNAMVDFSLAVGEDLTVTKEGFFNKDNSRIYTQITPEELKAKYAEAGYDWDYKTDTVKPIKWMLKDGDVVWYLNVYMEVQKFIFSESGIIDRELLEKRLLFKTEEECQNFSDHCWEFINNKDK